MASILKSLLIQVSGMRDKAHLRQASKLLLPLFLCESGVLTKVAKLLRILTDAIGLSTMLLFMTWWS